MNMRLMKLKLLLIILLILLIGKKIEIKQEDAVFCSQLYVLLRGLHYHTELLSLNITMIRCCSANVICSVITGRCCTELVWDTPDFLLTTSPACMMQRNTPYSQMSGHPHRGILNMTATFVN